MQPQQKPSRPLCEKHTALKQILPNYRNIDLVKENRGVQSQLFSKYYIEESDLTEHTRTQLILITEDMKNACRGDRTARCLLKISTLFVILFLYFLGFSVANTERMLISKRLPLPKKCLAHEKQAFQVYMLHKVLNAKVNRHQ